MPAAGKPLPPGLVDETNFRSSNTPQHSLTATQTSAEATSSSLLVPPYEEPSVPRQQLRKTAIAGSQPAMHAPQSIMWPNNHTRRTVMCKRNG
jgi:hypothetical protein